jgi:hypothetical protein
MSRTLAQRTNHDGFPKPGEMIGMTGTHALEACERAMINVLYQHAHDSGRLGEAGTQWEIPLSVLREAYSRHENNGRLRDSLKRLMSVLVEVSYLDERDDASEPEMRIAVMGIFRFLDISARSLPSERRCGTESRRSSLLSLRTRADGDGLRPRSSAP